MEGLEVCIQSVFDGLFQADLDRIDRVHGAGVDRIVSAYGDKLKKFDWFDSCLRYEADGFLEEVVRRLYPGLDSLRYGALCFVYVQYGFMECNIQKLIAKFEGHSCCADKSRWILERYRDYILTGAVPDMSISEGCFWKPNFGDGELWIEFCDALWRLFYGDFVKYLHVLKVMSKVRTGNE